MRVIKELNKNFCKITVFQWNGKYILKLEQGSIEQSFKIDELELSSENDIDSILNTQFLDQARQRFIEMQQSLILSIDNL